MIITNTSYECDGISNVHDPITVSEDTDAMRVYCKQCGNQYVIMKNTSGTPEKNQYAAIFKRDILQGSDNLFYKIYPQWLQQ